MFSLFVSTVISLLVTTLAIYLLCKHKKLRTLVAMLNLQQVKEVITVPTQKEINTECKNSGLYKFGSNNVWSRGVCSYTLQNIKALQRTHVL